VNQNYYIYYRVAAAPDEVRATASAMQAALVEETGVRGRLLHRAGDQGTWMEVYENVLDETVFERELNGAVERFGLRRLLAPGAERHVERFVGD
jgi:Domain of unknown function (DUF4936)